MSDIETEEIEKWCNSLFNLFRKEYIKLNSKERRNISNLDDLSPPCQVDLIWFRSKALDRDFQLLIFTHFKDRKDKEIRVFGPYEPSEAVIKFEELLKDRKWDRSLPRSKRYFFGDLDKRKYSSLIESHFVSTIKNFQNHFSALSKENKNLKKRVGKNILLDDSFTWHIRGNISKLNPENLVFNIIKDAKRRVTLKPQLLKEKKDVSLRGYGAHFYPPIWVGKRPKLSLEQKTFGSPLPLWSKIVLNTTYKGSKVIVENDGFIGIAESDMFRAKEKLNEIMAIANLTKIPSYSIKESELAEIKINPKSLGISSWTSTTSSLRTKLHEERWHNLSEVVYSERSIIPKNRLLRIIKIAEKVTEKLERKNDLIFILEAFTFFENTEFRQSYIMSWSIIENFIENEWNMLIEEKKIAGKRKDKLKNPISWSTDYILEVLSLSGKIKDKEYELLMKMKKKRNDIIHNGADVSRKEAKECLDLAFLFLTMKEDLRELAMI